MKQEVRHVIAIRAMLDMCQVKQTFRRVDLAVIGVHGL